MKELLKMRNHRKFLVILWDGFFYQKNSVINLISNVLLDGMNNGRKQFLEFFITFLYQALENKVFKEFRPSNSSIRYLQGIDI